MGVKFDVCKVLNSFLENMDELLKKVQLLIDGNKQDLRREKNDFSYFSYYFCVFSGDGRGFG